MAIWLTYNFILNKHNGNSADLSNNINTVNTELKSFSVAKVLVNVQEMTLSGKLLGWFNEESIHNVSQLDILNIEFIADFLQHCFNLIESVTHCKRKSVLDFKSSLAHYHTYHLHTLVL